MPVTPQGAMKSQRRQWRSADSPITAGVESSALCLPVPELGDPIQRHGCRTAALREVAIEPQHGRLGLLWQSRIGNVELHQRVVEVTPTADPEFVIVQAPTGPSAGAGIREHARGPDVFALAGAGLNDELGWRHWCG